MIVVLTSGHVVISNQIAGFDCRLHLCWKQTSLAQDKCTIQLCCEPRRGLRLTRSVEHSSAGEAEDAGSAGACQRNVEQTRCFENQTRKTVRALGQAT